MTKIALLIGVSEYEVGLNPLPAAVNDVEKMRQILINPQIGDFEPNQVKVLTNPDPLHMQIEIETAFAPSRHKNDLILFYFSGHGIKDERGNLYLASHLTRKTLEGHLVKATAVSASFIHNLMNDCRSKRQIIILDCCFSGAFAEGLLAKDDGGVDIKTQLGGEGRAILTSSSSTQYSYEQKGSELSIYTGYLTEGIITGIADQDNDGMIAVEELHEYAKSKVQEAAPAMKPEIYAIKEGYKILLAKAPVSDPRLSYRKEVERFANHGEISLVGQIVLEEQRKKLGLSEQEAENIEEEVLRPHRDYQRKLQLYEQTLTQVLTQKDTLGKRTLLELEELQEILGLTDEDIAPIEANLIEPKTEPNKSISSSPPVLETDISPVMTDAKAVVTPPEAIATSLDPAFLAQCERELARFIGPMANFIIEDVLAQSPWIKPQAFVDALAAEIPNPKQAQDFKKQLNLS